MKKNPWKKRILVRGNSAEMAPAFLDANGYCNLRQYSKYKKLPENFLKKLRLKDGMCDKKIALAIPYFDEEGNRVCYRFRKYLTGIGRFQWDKGARPMPYGLWKLKEAREKEYVVLVRTESDCHTLWFKKIPAMGLTEITVSEIEQYFRGLEELKSIYAVIFPGDYGKRLLDALKKSALRDRIEIVQFEKDNGLNDLFLRFRKKFGRRFKKLLKSAQPLRDLLMEEAKAKRKEAWRLCRLIRKKENILDLFVEDLKKVGVVGDEKLSKCDYLALTSRLLEAPVSVIIKGESSTDKSFVPMTVLKFFPESAYYKLTSSSDRSLIYSDESFEHRFVIYLEKAGVKGGFQEYIIRTLMSEGEIIYYVKGRKIVKKGPTGFITATTDLSVDEQNETRIISLDSDDSGRQTKRIILATAEKHQEIREEVPVNLAKWIAYQNWLEYTKHKVKIPYAVAVGKLIDPKACRLRRDFPQVVSLIQTHALMHQQSRKPKKKYILANLADYRAVYDLVAEPISYMVGASVPRRIRKTVKAVKEIIKGKSGGGKYGRITDLMEKLKLDESSTRRRVEIGIRKGFLKSLEGRKDSPNKIVLGEPMPVDKGILPTPKALEKYLEKEGYKEE